MMRKTYITLTTILILLTSAISLEAAVEKPGIKAANSFAVIVDNGTYNYCKENIHKYKTLLEKEGLATFIVYEDWSSPEQVKECLAELYKSDNLNGAVFVGDIPIPMVRRAQHLTSAFKMDQERFQMIQSSVPSDRFYDDFNLKFNFIGKDSTKHNLFYYNLAGDGVQSINCTIYSGRIKASKSGEEGYRQIDSYFTKLLKERSRENYLDHVTSYTGEGSFSNCLIAWKDEQITLAEQMPLAFNSNEGARFYIYAMFPYVKDVLTQELKRADLDYMVFHEHGDTEIQYISGQPVGREDEQFYANARYIMRRRMLREKDTTAFKARMKEEYGLNNEWFKANSVADSLEDARRKFYVQDIREINPNPRMVVFDACYNGDFRDITCIAMEYILGSGSTVVTFANSVNVLQDKSSSDLLGLLSNGARVGEWAMNVNILESHIIGDPTFKFTAQKGSTAVNYFSKDLSYWKNIFEQSKDNDVRGLALHKLYNLNYKELPVLLFNTYKNSDSYMLRLQCMHLLAHYKGELYPQLLKLASKDNYEFIRRKAAYYMSQSGNDEFVPTLAEMYLANPDAKRIVFNVSSNAGLLGKGKVKEEIEKRINESGFYFLPDEFNEVSNALIDQSERLADDALNELANGKNDKARCYGAVALRNKPYPAALPAAYSIIKDTSASERLRVTTAEALGWYIYSPMKEEIIKNCKEALAGLQNENGASAALKDELTKTINRLNDYLR